MATAKRKKESMLHLFEELLKLPVVQFPLSKVVDSQALNSRVGAIDDDHVETLMFMALDGAEFPPVLLIPRGDGTAVPGWGRHRIEMYDNFANGHNCKRDAQFEAIPAIMPTEAQIGAIMGCAPRALTNLEVLSLASTENDTALSLENGVWAVADSHSPKAQKLADYVFQIETMLEHGASRADCKRYLPVMSKAEFERAYKLAESRDRNRRQGLGQDQLDLYAKTGGKQGMDAAAVHAKFFPGWEYEAFENLMWPGKKKAGSGKRGTALAPPPYLTTFQGNFKKQVESLKGVTNRQLGRVIEDYSARDAGVTVADAEKIFAFVGKQLKTVTDAYAKKRKQFEERKNGRISQDEE